MPRSFFNGSLLGSIIFHVVVLSVLIISFEFQSKMPVVENIDNHQEAISAIAVNAPPAPVTPAPPVVKEEVKKIAEIPREKAPPPPPKVEAIPIKAKLDKPKPKEDLAKKLLADIQKKAKEDKKKKQKLIEQAMEKEMKVKAKSLQDQLLSEQKRIAGAKAIGEVNKYKALIVQAISRHWVVPGGANKKIYSELFIHLAPGGVVLDVQVSRTSGDVALDRSARDAVLKASPLPVPAENNAFEPFRQFVLKVRPENIVVNDA